MDSVVLKCLAVENYASFADRIEFTTEIDKSKKDTINSTFFYDNLQLNKVSFLYGANGSGKTFFCKILREIQRLLDWSSLTTLNQSQLSTLPIKEFENSVPTFAFDKEYTDKPTKFEIEILIGETMYHYEFSILDEKVIYELLTKKRIRTEKLIERTSSSFKDIVLKSEFKDFENTKHVVKEEALCLSIAALLNNEIAMKINDAIHEIKVVSMTAARLKPMNATESFSEERIKKYVEILKKADPTLRNINISFEEEEVGHQKVESDDFENREIIATKMKIGVEGVHAFYENGEETEKIAPFTFFADESLGTVKLFTALPYLFDVLENGGVLIVDEIENGLHLSLVKEIVNLFTNEITNPFNAQLICTSHQPLLLDGDFRRDQVWISTKDQYGKSTLKRLSDFKTSRSKVSLTNKILNGVFGCNPDKFFE